MDEYDVFMDQKARSKTLELLKLHALSAEQQSKQFIILTPLQLNDVITSNKVRIHGLRPPDRVQAHGLQQQTL